MEKIALNNIKLTNLTETLEDYCKDFKKYYVDQLDSARVNSTGNLANNFSVSVSVNGHTVLVQVNAPDYMEYVENGRKPGKFPPLVKIQEWIQNKPILPRPLANGKLPSTEQLSFLIARKIAEQGIEPGKQLEKTKQYINDIYKERIEEALQKDFNVYFLGILEKINKILR